jgi:hypothetical protein
MRLTNSAVLSIGFSAKIPLSNDTESGVNGMPQNSSNQSRYDPNIQTATAPAAFYWRAWSGLSVRGLYGSV